MLFRIRACSLLVLVILLLAGMGCGGASKAKGVVKGQVTIGGKPLYTGSVIFHSADGRTGAANIDHNGNYDMGDAPVGDVKISVTVPKMSGPAGMMGQKGVPAPPKGLGEMKDPNKPSESSSSQPLDPSKIVPIPDRYADPEKSGLTYKVEKGEHTFDIKLTP
jgi:hypothetical protein